jgi:hypothetical protein
MQGEHLRRSARWKTTSQVYMSLFQVHMAGKTTLEAFRAGKIPSQVFAAYKIP